MSCILERPGGAVKPLLSAIENVVCCHQKKQMLVGVWQPNGHTHKLLGTYLVFCSFSQNLKRLALMIFDLWYSKEGKTWFKKGAFVHNWVGSSERGQNQRKKNML